MGYFGQRARRFLPPLLGNAKGEVPHALFSLGTVTSCSSRSRVADDRRRRTVRRGLVRSRRRLRENRSLVGLTSGEDLGASGK